jgi:microcystin-dependent protein
MAQPYVGELRIFAGNFAPAGWMFCQGQLLPISEYDTLYNLIGTTYGGDGQSTFGLPNLASRVPVHQGTLAGGSTYTVGQTGGTESVALTTQQMPAHSHAAVGSSAAAGQGSPSGGTWAANSTLKPYATPADSAMNPANVGNAGGSQPHDNMLPYLAINYIISMFGIFPSQT